MIVIHPLAALTLSAAMVLSTSACAASVAVQQDEIIRTAPAGPNTSRAPTPSTAQTFDAISNFLDDAAAAWSSNDVEVAMGIYAQGEPLLVLLGDTPLKGPDAVRAALEARSADGGLGAMSYEWFETMQFDVNTAVVSGRVIIVRKGETHRGLFTRVLRRTDEGWRIVHDQLAWGPRG